MTHWVVLALLAFATPTGAYAQAFPTKVITIVVPFSAGGPTDTVTRLLGQSMSKTLGQKVIVENVGGAGGTDFGRVQSGPGRCKVTAATLPSFS
jgi:tripartite-type tricarboxylate transporter receptor subunit TctC